MTEEELYNYLRSHLAIRVNSCNVGQIEVTLEIKNPLGEWEDLDRDSIYIRQDTDDYWA